MTIKSSGSQLSFTNIADEFGFPPNNNLGAYRVSQDVGSLNDLPLDTNVPQTGQIKFSDFYSKKLNIVVKCEGGNLASADYDDDSVVIGGFRSKPNRNNNAWQGGKKIFINITGIYSSNGASLSGSQSQRSWAFRTGNSTYWPTDTTMTIDVSSDGQVVGRGGRGGNESGGNGQNGSNGLRYLSGATLNNLGYISAGGGGGGGGSHAEQNDWGDKNDAEGGGGGGGNGLPAGAGGRGNGGGSAGSLKNGGSGQAGEDDSEAEGGSGGKGGSNGGDGNGATGGRNKEESNGSGGEGGKATETY
tara:strand:- start:1324 stop:2229 length:906 start_codon:yes stop_codon:yes gene_type:complete